MTHSTGIFFADSDDDMDLFEGRLPDGIITVAGAAAAGPTSSVGMIEMKVSLGLDCAQGILSIELARDLIEALEAAVDDAAQCTVTLDELTAADSSEPTLQ